MIPAKKRKIKVNKTIFAAIATLALIAPANADGYYTAPVSYKDAPPVVITNNWTGAYVGGLVGGSYDTQTIKEFSSVFTEDVVKGLSNTAVLLGGYGGYDYELNTGIVPSGIVIGAWVDGAFTSGGNSTLLDAIYIHENNTFAMGARVGYAVFPSFMPYVTGGFTMADYSLSLLGDPVHAGNMHNLSGGTVGAGMEFQITPRVFAKVEYRHDMYDTKTLADFSNREFVDLLRDNLNANRVMLGIHYKFNDSTGGLIATRAPCCDHVPLK